MDRILKLFMFNEMRIIKQTLLGRNRSRQRPELGRIDRKDLDLVISESFKNFNILKVGAPLEKTLGARLMLRSGIMSLALFEAIRNVVEGEDYATELCTDILWKLYVRQIKAQRIIALLIHRDPRKQMKMIQRLFLRFPLARPGYEWETKEFGEAAAVYDITRCPVYDFYKTRDKADLEFFRNSWCTLDFPLAEHLVRGGKYERTKTLSHGDDRCDMCWKVEGV